MTKTTRHELFHKSFVGFMKKYFPDIERWTIEPNKKYRSETTHVYRFKIPDQNVLYYVDTMNVETGIGESIPHYQSQELPVRLNFYGYFKEYYKPFYLYNEGQVIACVRYCIPPRSSLSHIDSFEYDIEVIYNKGYAPYPVDNDNRSKTYKDLEEEIKRLINIVQDYNNDIDTYINVCNNYKYEISSCRRKIKHERQNTDRYKKIHFKMKSKMKELYKEKLEECPVCYEVIQPDKLDVPPCCHFICNDCSDRLLSCPLCREDYLNVC